MARFCRGLLILAVLALIGGVGLLFWAAWPCSAVVLVILLIAHGRRGAAYVRDAFGSARFALDEELRRRGMIDEE